MRWTGSADRGGTAAVLASGLAIAVLSGGCAPPVTKVATVTKEQEAESRRKEIRALEKSLQEEILKARNKGATEAQIDDIKARYKSEIDRLKDELPKGEPAEGERSKDAAQVPDAGKNNR